MPQLLGRLSVIGLIIGISGMAAGLAAGQETKQPAEKAAPIIGGVRILPDKAGLEIEGKVSLNEGILEFLSVVMGGREYESLLALNCKPSALHAALLAMGAKPGATPGLLKWLAKNSPEEAKAARPKGSELLIDVEWKTPDGKSVKMPATSLLFSRKTKQVEPETNTWIFTGSTFYAGEDGKRVYAADVDEAIISAMPQDAVIQIGEDCGNPYDATDQGFEANTKVMPKPGTPIKVTIRLKPMEK